MNNAVENSRIAKAATSARVIESSMVIRRASRLSSASLKSGVATSEDGHLRYPIDSTDARDPT
jgi:hypothetical protein